MAISAAFPVKPDGPRANCSDPELLPLIDAAHAKPGGPAAQKMKSTVCPRCPVGSACLSWAMAQREDGIWGGISPNTRTRHGAPGAGALGVHTSRATRRASSYRYQAIAAADVPTATIRAWALAHDLPVHPTKGRISEDIREQYAAAHERGAA